ncbi:MAG: hypothetical protein ABJD75_05070 [Parasphingorhabdus sp.]
MVAMSLHSEEIQFSRLIDFGSWALAAIGTANADSAARKKVQNPDIIAPLFAWQKRLIFAAPFQTAYPFSEKCKILRSNSVKPRFLVNLLAGFCSAKWAFCSFLYSGGTGNCPSDHGVHHFLTYRRYGAGEGSNKKSK